VFAEADHEQKDETDRYADDDTDGDSKQETFTQHQRQRQLAFVGYQDAENHSHSSFSRLSPQSAQSCLFISPVIFSRSFVIGGLMTGTDRRHRNTSV